MAMVMRGEGAVLGNTGMPFTAYSYAIILGLN
jgi:hypothetical protein